MIIQGGVSYPGAQVRDELGRELGVYGGLGVMLAEAAMIGMPTSDIDVRWHGAPAGRLVTVSALYVERAGISDNLWLGLGAGAVFQQARFERTAATGDEVEERAWGLGGKVTLGAQFSERFFLEGGWHYTGEVAGVATNGFTLAIGWWL
jgi:hypothetical protein